MRKSFFYISHTRWMKVTSFHETNQILYSSIWEIASSLLRFYRRACFIAAVPSSSSSYTSFFHVNFNFYPPDFTSFRLHRRFENFHSFRGIHLRRSLFLFEFSIRPSKLSEMDLGTFFFSSVLHWSEVFFPLIRHGKSGLWISIWFSTIFHQIFLMELIPSFHRKNFAETFLSMKKLKIKISTNEKGYLVSYF